MPDVEPTTVLLPVRDEEKNVESCLMSLLNQTAQPEIAVIDDGSTDNTAAIVRSLQRNFGNLHLLEAGPLPSDWRGKVHALHVGSRAVETPWILSTDADTRHHSELLACAQSTARQLGLDSISIAGYQEVRGLGEELMVPAVFALLDTLLGRWEKAASGNCRIANGQFILLRRTALEAIGGFEVIRQESIDDVALVSRLQDRGYRHAFIRAPDLLQIRMYRGLGETFRGWRRNLGGLGRGRWETLLTLLCPLLIPPLLILVGIWQGLVGVAIAAWLMGVGASALSRKGSGHKPWLGLLYPLDVLLVALCLVLSFVDYRRGRLVAWKGRPITLSS
jgi:glycosyltransferase involved in cell wall biosynthesis